MENSLAVHIFAVISKCLTSKSQCSTELILKSSNFLEFMKFDYSSKNLKTTLTDLSVSFYGRWSSFGFDLNKLNCWVLSALNVCEQLFTSLKYYSSSMLSATMEDLYLSSQVVEMKQRITHIARNYLLVVLLKVEMLEGQLLL